MDDLLIQLNKAKDELKIAEQNLSFADPNFIDIAIEELNLKRQIVNFLIRKIKTLKGDGYK